jgi:hypothetical protein
MVTNGSALLSVPVTPAAPVPPAFRTGTTTPTCSPASG